MGMLYTYTVTSGVGKEQHHTSSTSVSETSMHVRHLSYLSTACPPEYDVIAPRKGSELYISRSVEIHIVQCGHVRQWKSM